MKLPLLRASLVLLLGALPGCREEPVGIQPGPNIRFAEVSAGAQHTCATDTDATVWCWGLKEMGRLGSFFERPPCMEDACLEPVRTSDGVGLTGLDSGEAHTCGLAAATAYCWGFDWRGQLGDAHTVTQRCGDVNPLLCSVEPVPVAIGFRIVQVSAGAMHTCAVTDQQVAYCWGDARFDQIGHQVAGDSTSYPDAVAGGHRFVSISAGTSHTCAIDDDAQAWCWGADQEGRLGLGQVGSTPVPAPVTGDPRHPDPEVHDRLYWSRIDAGVAHTCGITTKRIAYCFGRGDRGRLGDSYGTAWWFPVRAEIPANDVVDVSAGGTHSCAVTADGSAWCWGGNEAGQLGDGTTADRLVPARVQSDESFASVSAGDRHTCALTQDGRVFCWGANAEGQLGLGDRQDRAAATQVAG